MAFTDVDGLLATFTVTASGGNTAYVASHNSAATYTSATVTIAAGLKTGQDSFYRGGPTAGFSGSCNSGTGVLIVTATGGKTATERRRPLRRVRPDLRDDRQHSCAEHAAVMHRHRQHHRQRHGHELLRARQQHRRRGRAPRHSRRLRVRRRQSHPSPARDLAASTRKGATSAGGNGDVFLIESDVSDLRRLGIVDYGTPLTVREDLNGSTIGVTSGGDFSTTANEVVGGDDYRLSADNGHNLMLTADQLKADALAGTGLAVLRPMGDSTAVGLGETGTASDFTADVAGTLAAGFSKKIAAGSDGTVNPFYVHFQATYTATGSVRAASNYDAQRLDARTGGVQCKADSDGDKHGAATPVDARVSQPGSLDLRSRVHETRLPSDLAAGRCRLIAGALPYGHTGRWQSQRTRRLRRRVRVVQQHWMAMPPLVCTNGHRPFLRHGEHRVGRRPIRNAAVPPTA